MDFNNFFKGLDPTIKFGVKLYTRNFDSINTKLRNGEPLGVVEMIVMKCLYIAYANMVPLKWDIVVYRGTQNFTSVMNNSFISTSLSQEVAEKFMVDDDGKEYDCCMFTITIPAGTKFVPIINNSYFDDEAEILLPPQSTFSIMDEFTLVYHAPVKPPKFKLSKWDTYIVNFFKVTTDDDYRIEQLESVLVKSYIPSLASLIETENLLKRFHLESTFVITDTIVPIWKKIVSKFGKELLQLVSFIYAIKNKELEFINHTPNVTNIIVDYSPNIFQFVNNLNLLTEAHISGYIDKAIPEIHNLNLKRLTIAHNTLEGHVDLNSIRAINLDNLKLQNVKVTGDIVISNLCELKIRGCELTAIPQNIYNLKLLKTLELDNNNIEDVSDDIQNLTSLTLFTIRHNPIRKFPDKIFETQLSLCVVSR